MTKFLIKPERNVDMYIEWSTITNSPSSWGTREQFNITFLDQDMPDKLSRADRHGTTLLHEEDTCLPFGYDDDTELTVRALPGTREAIQQASADGQKVYFTIQRSNLIALCTALETKSDVMPLLAKHTEKLPVEDYAA